MQRVTETLVALETILTSAFIALVFGIIRVLSDSKPQTFKQTVITLIIAVPVGTLGGLVAKELNAGDAIAYTVCSLCSLLSQDIIVGILNNRNFFGGLMRRASENLVDKVTK